MLSCRLLSFRDPPAQIFFACARVDTGDADWRAQGKRKHALTVLV